MYLFALVDDEKNDIVKLKNIIDDYCSQHSLKVSMDTYLKSTDFQYDKKYDAVFLDMEMPDKNGLSLAEDINNHYKTKIIFITNHKEYMHMTFNVNAFQFIHKEFIMDETFPVLDLLFNKLEKEYIVINNDKILLNDIYSIHIIDHEIEIITNNSKYSLWITLDEILKKINNKYFFKINRNTIINVKNILEINGLEVILKNKQAYMISRRLKKDFMQFYQSYLIENL